MDFPLRSWADWTKELTPDSGGAQAKATLPSRDERLRTAALLKAKRVPRRIVSKRPAASVVVKKTCKKQ
eukprot:5272316-Pyramimonas_sp.AAC.1